MTRGEHSTTRNMIPRNDKTGKPMRVDFGYTFSTPHRLTAALPDSSDKTLLDVSPGFLRMAWTYGNLLDKPLAAFVTPRTDWEVRITPERDGQPFARSRWSRVDGWLPVLANTYEDAAATVRLEVAGGRTVRDRARGVGEPRQQIAPRGVALRKTGCVGRVQPGMGAARMGC